MKKTIKFPFKILSLLFLANAIISANFFKKDNDAKMKEFAPRALDILDNSLIDLTSSTFFGEDSANAIDSLSSPLDFSSIDSFGNSTSTQGLINIDTNSELEHNRNYLKISQDLKAYEDAYKDCLEAVSDSDFGPQAVENCVGENYQFVSNDIDFEKRKILSRADSTIRAEMLANCYNDAGADLVMDNACDLIQKDTLDLLWSELNFEVLLEYHREKYVFVHSKIPDATFTKVINRFKDIYAELGQLIKELYDHWDLTIINLRREVEERSALVLSKQPQQSGLSKSDRWPLDSSSDDFFAGNKGVWNASQFDHQGNYNSQSSSFPFYNFNAVNIPAIFSDSFRKRALLQNENRSKLSSEANRQIVNDNLNRPYLLAQKNKAELPLNRAQALTGARRVILHRYDNARQGKETSRH